jgi:hypothetical protein
MYKTIILPFVLYGCEIWSLVLRKEHRLRIFENRVLRRIFGSKRNEVTGEWRKFHSKELHKLYSSPNITGQKKSRKMGLAGQIGSRTVWLEVHVATMGRDRKVYKGSVWKVRRKKTIRNPRSR